jgi:hypothetical protein
MGSAEDKLDILEIIGRYSFGADEFGPEAYVGVFTQEGTFQGRSGQPDEITIKGEKQLLVFAKSAYQRMGNRQNRHHQSSTYFLELESDKAKTRTYLMTTTVADGGNPQVGLTSIYEDELVRTSEGWRIESRKVFPDVKGTLREIIKR